MEEVQERICSLCGRPACEGQARCLCGNKLPREATSHPAFDFEPWLPWVPLAGAILFAWWAVHPGPIWVSLFPVFKVYAVTAILCAALTLLIAHRRDLMGREVERMSPTGWFAAVLFGWPVAMPIFLRDAYGSDEPGRMRTGYITEALFLLMMIAAIMLRGRGYQEMSYQMAHPKPAQPPAHRSAMQASNGHMNFPTASAAQAGPAPISSVANSSAPLASPAAAGAGVQQAQNAGVQQASSILSSPGPGGNGGASGSAGEAQIGVSVITRRK